MKKGNKTKYIVCVIIGLFIGASIVPNIIGNIEQINKSNVSSFEIISKEKNELAKPDIATQNCGTKSYIRFDNFDDYSVGEIPKAVRGWTTNNVVGDQYIEARVDPLDSSNMVMLIHGSSSVASGCSLRMYDFDTAGEYIFHYRIYTPQLSDTQTIYEVYGEHPTELVNIHRRTGQIRWGGTGCGFDEFTPPIEPSTTSWIEEEVTVTLDEFRMWHDNSIDAVGGYCNTPANGVHRWSIFPYPYSTQDFYIDDFWITKYDGGNQAPTTPYAPNGPTFIKVGEINTYRAFSLGGDPDGDDFFIQFDWDAGSGGSHEYSAWIEADDAGEAYCSHTRNSPGLYEIKAKAKDIHGAESRWSNSKIILVGDTDRPPEIPYLFDVPKSAELFEKFRIRVHAIDLNGDDVSYQIDWNCFDDDKGAWSEFYGSDEPAVIEYIPSIENITRDLRGLCIKVRAKDDQGNIGHWMDYVKCVDIEYNGIFGGEYRTSEFTATNFHQIKVDHPHNYLDYMYLIEEYDKGAMCVEFHDLDFSLGQWRYIFSVTFNREKLDPEWNADYLFIDYEGDKCSVSFNPDSCYSGVTNISGFLKERPWSKEEWIGWWLNSCMGALSLWHPLPGIVNLAREQTGDYIARGREGSGNEILFEPDSKYGQTENKCSVNIEVECNPSIHDGWWYAYFDGGVRYPITHPASEIRFSKDEGEIIFGGPILPIPNIPQHNYIKIGVYAIDNKKNNDFLVNLTVTTPNNGSIISESINTSFTAYYNEIDINGDEILDKQIVIPHAWCGNYSIYIHPNETAESDDAFTIIVNDNGQNITLVNNETIVNLNESVPYIYEKPEPIWGPTLTGPISGPTNNLINFTANSTTLYNMTVYEYLIDWGNNTVDRYSNITGPFNTTENISVNHIWQKPGTHNIRVKTKDSLNQVSNWSTPHIITLTGSPYAEFNYTPSYPDTNETITFNDLSVDDNNIVNWNWDFGDGNISYEQNPTHQYITPGYYIITLNVTGDDALSDNYSKIIEVILDQPPVADFLYSPLNPEPGQNISFIDFSFDLDDTLLNWTWDFDDGNTSNTSDVLHNYTVSGIYNVTLIVIDEEINVSYTRPIADFYYAPLTPDISDYISFIDLSYESYGDIVDWNWDFGDGNISYSQNPTHQYIVVGNYTVNLTVIDDDGENNSICKTVNVSTDMINVDISLVNDWNLITVPAETGWWASNMSDNITGCTSVSRWDAINQTYHTYIVGGPPTFDFLIKDGFGYFVDMTGSDTLSTLGYPITSVNIPLEIGWNLLGWYHDDNTTASSLSENITGCTSVSRWNATLQTYNTYIVGGPPTFDFTIVRGMGLFVDVTEESIWYGDG